MKVGKEINKKRIRKNLHYLDAALGIIRSAAEKDNQGFGKSGF